MLVYYVEDDNSISDVIKKVLLSIDLDYQSFTFGHDLYKAFKKEKPDLILLDVMLPDISGLELLKKIRAIDIKIPIIMISALSSEIDKVIALDYGADDYVTKPFGILELKSRILANTRKIPKHEKITFGCVSISNYKNQAFCHSYDLNLTNKEYDILHYLIIHPNQTISKDEMIDKLWNGEFLGETRVIDVHINSLRKKLLSNNANISIETIFKKGYRVVVNN